MDGRTDTAGRRQNYSNVFDRTGRKYWSDRPSNPPGDTKETSNTHRRRKELIKKGKKRDRQRRCKKEENPAKAK